MDQDVREAAISLEMDLIRLDMDIQTSYSVTGPDEADYSDMLRVSGDPPPKKAALERDYMRADGSYTLADVPYYISPTISGTTTDSSGLYPIDSCGVTLVQQRGTLSPVSLVLEADPAVGKVQGGTRELFLRPYLNRRCIPPSPGLPGIHGGYLSHGTG